MQGLGLTASQHYGVGYDYGHKAQLERSASTITDFSTYWRDTMMILCLIAIQCENDYIMYVFMKVFCEIY